MRITIEIDTNEQLSPEELSVLRAIYAENNSASPKTPAEKAEEKPAPARRGRPKKVEEPTPEPEVEEAVEETPAVAEDEEPPAVLEDEKPLSTNLAAEELADTESGEDAPTLEDAVAAATPLISAGKAKDVKEALTAAGVKKVKELPADKIAGFIADLKKIGG